MRISTVKYTVKQGLKNIIRNKMFSIASIATMVACIFLFGIFFSILTNFRYIVNKAEEGVAIVVFLNEGLAESERESIEESLKNRDDVSEVKYISADQAWEEFKKEYLGENVDDAAFTENPLENSDNFEVYMKTVDTQDELVSFAESLPGVRKVNRSEMVADTLSNVNMLIAYISGAIILILLVVAVFLISNTVTMGITIRREEIAIMKYIGAKDAFVRAPFVIEGVLIGLIGAVIPLTLLYFGYDKTIHYIMTRFSILNNILDFLPVNQVYQILLPIGLLLGVGIGFIGSFFTIRKHLHV